MENFLCQECEKCSLTNKKRILHSKVHALNETLKIHVISNHFGEYFSKMGETFYNTNGEGLETAHSSLRISEERHCMKIIRKIVTPLWFIKQKESCFFTIAKGQR